MEGAKREAEREKAAEKDMEMKPDEETATKPEILPGQTYLSTEGSVRVAGVYEEVKEEANGKHENGDGEKELEEKMEDKDGNEETNVTDGEDVAAVMEAPPVQKTTLADVGFNLDGEHSIFYHVRK